MNDFSPITFEILTVVDWDDWQKECVPRLHYAKSLEILHLPQLLEHDGICAIVGAGPSAAKYIKEIEAIGEGEFNLVMSVNATHDWLIAQDIVPDIHVIFEMDVVDIKTALGGKPKKGVVYYIASHCSQEVFKQLEGYNRVLWHAYCPPEGYQEQIAALFPGEFMVAGGFATFFRSLSIALILGYRRFELFGLDSSFEATSHLEGYPTADKEAEVEVWVGEKPTDDLKKYRTQGGLAFQANEFMEFCKINQAGLRLRVHGEGLLRHLHESNFPEQYQPQKDQDHAS